MLPKLTTFYRGLRICILVLGLGDTVRAGLDTPLEPAALAYTRTRSLTEQDPNLTGEGVLIAAVCRSMTYVNDAAQDDYRFNMNHNSLYRADVAFADGTDGRMGISSHATALAGILVGQDDAAQLGQQAPFGYRGACPAASVDVYEFWRFATLHLYDKQPFEADIVSLSLGLKYEDWWTRAFENLAVENNMIVIASIGNGRSEYDMLYPGAGSNCIGVGVIDAAVDDNGAVSLTDFTVPHRQNSSSGPTSDRRCKPDIVAPGTALVPTHNGDADYVIRKNWSSLAAPVVSGTAALLVQKAYSNKTLGQAFDQPGKNCVMKAVLLNSAAKLPYWHKGDITPDDDSQTPLDFIQGAGALDAAAAYRQLTAGLQPPGPVEPIGWDNRVLDPNTVLEYTITGVDPNQMITATLCWNYHYQASYPFDHELEKDANLRLELWGIDPADPDVETRIDLCDSLNDNLEHIYVPADPRFTGYRLRVLFSEQSASLAPARCALAWSVTDDTAAGNQWWYDLNGDDQVNGLDYLAWQLIDTRITDHLDGRFAEQALKLSPARLNLLTAGWQTWKPYLADAQTVFGNFSTNR